ncbi:Fic family protein [Acidobacteria bacterium AH-259-D05]|nr:Fic family protein [Acidobacteria bacterium AH-259-D05]
MAAPNKKLVASLTALQKLQKGGRRVFQSKELTRLHRERLLRHGILREVMKGWLISSGPGTDKGDSTPWYASFWEFCARYCKARFGNDWHLSPEQSLLLQAESTVVPTQVIVCSPKGTNNTVNLLFGTSLYDLRQQEMPPGKDIVVWDELRLCSPAAALIRVPEAFFNRNPVETQVVLASVRDSSDVLARLLDGGHSVVAGRLAGAFRRIGRTDLAEDILSTMKTADYDVRETDPFRPQQTFGTVSATASPIVGRLQTLWELMRGVVVETFPKPPGLPRDRKAYLRFIDEIYQNDAYHSLSIEGYRVTPELIERVRSGAWDPENCRDALAARGYWQAFQLVKETVSEIITGTNPGILVRTAHRDWYRELFKPCVVAGLISPSALAGYRSEPVFLRKSRHVPPRWEAVADAMPALFDLLESEPEAAVRAVLGHWMFGYVHPYQDGNGRMARFMMNAMLASGGYQWTIISVKDRTAYLSALDCASVDSDIRPFAVFVAERVQRSV